MRVLMVTGSYPPMKCGVGDYSRNLAEALAVNHEFHVAILTSISGTGEDKAENLEIFPIMRSWGLAEALKVIKAIRRWSPDIVHIQYPTQGYGGGSLPWVLPMIAALMRRKVVQTWHEGYSGRDAPELFLKSIVPSWLIFVRPQYETKLHPHLRWALWRKRTAFISNASSIPRVKPDEQMKDEIRKRYVKKQKRLIVFFGFVYPNKGVELLFAIADCALDQIVIAGGFDENSEYGRDIIKRASTEEWLGKVTITGFLPVADVAELLAVADAVILPFRTGGGEWNTSIHGAVLNGAFVITTSLTERGYDGKRNVYFAEVDNVQEMKLALGSYAGRRREYDADIDVNEWRKIGHQHRLLYESIVRMT
jgi:glycosyltransferase involved in cell wall biosynthesis